MISMWISTACGNSRLAGDLPLELVELRANVGVLHADALRLQPILFYGCSQFYGWQRAPGRVPVRNCCYCCRWFSCTCRFAFLV